MTLTPEEINKVRKASGLAPLTPMGTAPVSLADRPIPTAPASVENPKGVVETTVDNIKNTVKKSGEKAYDEVHDTNQNPIVAGFKGAAEVAKGIGEVALDVAKPVVQTGIENVEKVFKDNPFYKATKFAIGKGAENILNVLESAKESDTTASIGQKLNDLAKAHPEIAKTVEDTLQILSSGGEIANTVLGAEGLANTAAKTATIADEALASTKNTVKNVAETVASNSKKAAVVAEDAKALESITPTTKELTPTEYKDLLSFGKISPKTATKPSEYILSDAEKATATKYKTLLQDKDPVKNSINVMDEIASKDEQVGTFLKANNGIYNKGELKNYVLGKLSDISDVTIDPARVETLKNTVVNNFIKTLKKGDMENLWKARKEFDSSIEKAFSGSPTLQNTVKKEFRNAVQDFIADNTPDNIYKGYMKDMRELFNIQDVLATKASKVKNFNKIQEWIKDNPAKAKVLGLVAGSGIVGTGYGILK